MTPDAAKDIARQFIALGGRNPPIIAFIRNGDSIIAVAESRNSRRLLMWLEKAISSNSKDIA
ncbi:hypothetical protein BEE12_00350 [Pantoea agglomerans]|nr:hypothetical protein BEE12_00350 [Pantoea agglomerans]